MTYEEWLAKFKPILNHLTPDAPYDGRMFETYGAEYSQVQIAPPDNVWTLITGDGYTVISKGYHFVNRMGYFVAEVPFTDDDPDEIILDEPYYSVRAVDPNTFQIVGDGGHEVCVVAGPDAAERAELVCDALNCSGEML